MASQEEIKKLIDKLNMEELEKVVGGTGGSTRTDYSFASAIIAEFYARYQDLLKKGVSEANARAQVRSEYWDRVYALCAANPDSCGPQKMTEMIFALTIGS